MMFGYGWPYIAGFPRKPEPKPEAKPEPDDDLLYGVVYRYVTDTPGKCETCHCAYKIGDSVVQLGTRATHAPPVVHTACFEKREAA